MELAVRFWSQPDSVEPMEVSDKVFGGEYREALVHQVVTAFMARARAGTKANKNRSAVSGGGIKPWRQKGTGRARAGTSRSPLWRGGGVTFAAVPRNYAQKVNRQMYRAGLRSILSELVRTDRLLVVDTVDLASHKTQALAAALRAFNLDSALIVTEEINENLYLASRNLPKIQVCDRAAIDPVSLIRFDKIVFTRDAIKNYETQLS